MLMLKRTRIAGFILVVSVLGCGEQRDDCRTLIDTIGPRLSAIHTLEEGGASEAGPPGPTLEATSAAYAELAESLQHASLSTLKSKHVAEELRYVARELATELRNLAVAVEREDEALLKTATKRLKQFELDEQRFGDHLLGICGKR